jgi:hypothetical protein
MLAFFTSAAEAIRLRDQWTRRYWDGKAKYFPIATCHLGNVVEGFSHHIL